jgi:Arc/MetJ family transcription regulator
MLNTMRRTHLYIDDALWQVLRIRAQEARTTVSNLVRQAVQEKYSTGLEGRQQAMRAFAGIWKDRTDLPDAEAYVRSLRKGSRLQRLQSKPYLLTQPFLRHAGKISGPPDLSSR